jgi:hypothetical protein
MGDVIALLVTWPLLLTALGVWGFAPGVVNRLIARMFPLGDPRRKEMVAELYEVPRWEQPFWVAQQLERGFSEGLPARLRRRRKLPGDLQRIRDRASYEDGLWVELSGDVADVPASVRGLTLREERYEDLDAARRAMAIIDTRTFVQLTVCPTVSNVTLKKIQRAIDKGTVQLLDSPDIAAAFRSLTRRPRHVTETIQMRDRFFDRGRGRRRANASMSGSYLAQRYTDHLVVFRVTLDE